MKQASFKFTSPSKAVFKFDKERYQGADPKATWAGVVLADPVKYPGLMQTIAKKALDRDPGALVGSILSGRSAEETPR